MTRAERLKLAKAARELAYAFAEGSKRKLSTHDWCGCAIGVVVAKSRVRRGRWRRIDLAFDIDQLLTDDSARNSGGLGVVSIATDVQTEGGVPGAVVFPLLALADELESGR